MTRTRILIISRPNANLFALGAGLAFERLRAVVFVLAMRTIKKPVTNVLLVHTSSTECGVFMRWTQELADVTFDYAVCLFFGIFTVGNAIAHPMFLRNKTKHKNITFRTYS